MSITELRIDQETRRHRPWLAVPWIMSVGLVVYWIIRGNRYSLWFDEAFSVQLSRAQFSELVRKVTVDEANMGPYYLLLWFWEKVLSGAFWARGLSVLGSVVAVWGLWHLMRRRADDITAAAVVSVFAVNPFVLSWTIQARGYTLVLALVAWSLVLADRFATRGRWIDAVSFGVLTGVCVATLLTSMFVLMGVFGLVLLLRPGWKSAGQLAVAGLSALAAFVPFVVPFVTSRDQILWIEPLTLERFQGELRASVGGAPTALIYIFTSAIGFVRSIKFGQLRSMLVPHFLALIGLVGLLFLDQLVQPVFIHKYLAASLPLTVIGVVGWIHRVSLRKRTFFAVCLIAVSLLATAIRGQHASPVISNYRWAADLIQSEILPGDVVATFPEYTLFVVEENWRGDRSEVNFGTVETGADRESAEKSRSIGTPQRAWVVVDNSTEGVPTSRIFVGQTLESLYPIVLDQRTNGSLSVVLRASEP